MQGCAAEEWERAALQRQLQVRHSAVWGAAASLGARPVFNVQAVGVRHMQEAVLLSCALRMAQCLVRPPAHCGLPR